MSSTELVCEFTVKNISSTDNMEMQIKYKSTLFEDILITKTNVVFFVFITVLQYKETKSGKVFSCYVNKSSALHHSYLNLAYVPL
jgi:hypothetical protein